MVSVKNDATRHRMTATTGENSEEINCSQRQVPRCGPRIQPKIEYISHEVIRNVSYGASCTNFWEDRPGHLQGSRVLITVEIITLDTSAA